MPSVARQLMPTGPSLSCGTVLAVGDAIAVRGDSGVMRARKAASCLLDVDPGDLVLVCSIAEGESYVLSVLMRKNRTAHLSIEGDLRLEARSGSVELIGSESIRLGTSGKLGMVSAELDVCALEGNLSFEKASFVASFLSAKLETVRMVAEVFHSFCGTIFQQAKRVFRRADEIEKVSAAQIDYSAEELVSIHGKTLLGTAKELVKFDGEQIHLG